MKKNTNKQSILHFTLFFLIIFTTGFLNAYIYKKPDHSLGNASKTRGTLPSSKPCYAISGRLKSLQQAVVDCCTDLTTEIDQVISKAQSILPCNQYFSIAQTDIPLTISSSGNYCLSENILTLTPNVAITIDADDVTIDLNGFSISGGSTLLQTTTGHRNITISNGSLENAEPNGTADGYGLFVNGSTTVELNNVIISGNLVGVLFVDTNGIKINSCNVLQNSGAGIVFSNSSSGVIQETLIVDNVFTSSFELPGGLIESPNACLITSSSGLTFIETQFSHNSSTVGAFDVVLLESSSNCIFELCSASNNTSDGVGFKSSETQAIIWLESQADNNSDGFIITTSSREIELAQCMATNNSSNGFMITGTSFACHVVECAAYGNSGNGFEVSQNSNNNILRRCSAIGNDNGFSVDATSSTVLFSNYTENNTQNYQVVTTDFTPTYTHIISSGTYGPVTPRLGNVTKWDNIDASA